MTTTALCLGSTATLKGQYCKLGSWLQNLSKGMHVVCIKYTLKILVAHGVTLTEYHDNFVSFSLADAPGQSLPARTDAPHPL